MMTISVIVPFHNSERYIAQCIDGLLAQPYPADRYEILMVDNNSTDASAEIVRRHPRIKLICEEKRGAYAARNRGVSEANGEVIVFIDPDCVPSNDWLLEIESAMSLSHIGIVVGSHEFDGGSFLLSMLARYENEKKHYVFQSERRELYYGHANNMAVRKSLFEQEGPFIETMRGSDTVFVRRCVDRHSHRVARYAEASVRHLEIDSTAIYLRKVFIYGRSSRKFGHRVFAQPLANSERFQIFLSTVRRQRYSPARSCALLCLLLLGLASWSLGRVSVIGNCRMSLPGRTSGGLSHRLGHDTEHPHEGLTP